MAISCFEFAAKDVVWEVSKSTASDFQIDLPEGHSVFTMVPPRGINRSKSETNSSESINSQYLRTGNNI